VYLPGHWRCLNIIKAFFTRSIRSNFRTREHRSHAAGVAQHVGGRRVSVGGYSVRYEDMLSDGWRPCVLWPRSWRWPPHLPLCQTEAPRHRRTGALQHSTLIQRGHKGPTRSALSPGSLPCSSSRRRRQDEVYTTYPLAIYDNRATYVGILRQSCRPHTKTWEHVPPSC
jgi:hypothetical protein